MKHTKEPWEVAEDKCYMNQIINSNSCCIAKLLEEADSQRIVACVNACKGITTEALAAGVIAHTIERYADICISKQLDIYGDTDVSENLVSKDTMTYKGHKIWEEE